MTLLSRDGVFHTGSYLTLSSLSFVPGTRSDVVVRCSAATVGSTVTMSLSGTAPAILGTNIHTQATLMTMVVSASDGSGSAAVPTDFATLPTYMNSMLSTTPTYSLIVNLAG